MNRTLATVAIVALALAALALAGCTTSEQAKEMKVWGYVAAEQHAQLEVAESQSGVESLVVDRVLAPEDSWIVVHADDDGAPGMRVGLARVEAGESKAVEVALEDVETPNVIVAVHADRGESGEFDFDMMKKEMSPDRPFFVNGAELAAVVAVR